MAAVRITPHPISESILDGLLLLLGKGGLLLVQYTLFPAFLIQHNVIDAGVTQVQGVLQDAVGVGSVRAEGGVGRNIGTGDSGLAGDVPLGGVGREMHLDLSLQVVRCAEGFVHELLDVVLVYPSCTQTDVDLRCVQILGLSRCQGFHIGNEPGITLSHQTGVAELLPYVAGKVLIGGHVLQGLACSHRFRQREDHAGQFLGKLIFGLAGQLRHEWKIHADTLSDGDSQGFHSSTTTNKQNADIVQALAHMSGRVCIMKTRHHPEHPEWKDAYVLDIWLSPKNGHEIRVKPCVEMFNGKVYCAVTSTGYFLVRRNGRVWVTGNSGRLVQLQNLPQNKMPDLEQARALVRSGNYDAVRLLYDSTLDVLSQLIRTAFVPREGCTFFVADFSAIEARVLAWLAGEEWRMELFRQGGDIYCQSASQMFGVPVEKHGVNGHLRQKGKVAELACIAEGQMVLTDKGEVPIQDVTTDMKVWDGEGWVAHEGLVYRSEREVITYEGLTATPDHLVWVEGQSEPIPLGKAALCHARLMPVSNPSTPCAPFNLTPLVMPTYDLKNAGPHHRFTVSGHLVHNCGYGGSVGALKAMGAIEMGLQEDELKPLVDAWRSANPKIVKLWWEVDDAVMTAIRKKTTTGTHGLLFTCKSGMLFITLPSGRQLAYVKPRIGENQFGSPAATYMGTNTSKQWARLESYGPKFVENVVQAISRDILCYAMQTLRSCSIVAHVHDELIIEADPRMSLEAVCEQMGRTPPWAQGLQLRADGYTTDFYKKD